MATSPLNWEEITALREAAHQLDCYGNESSVETSKTAFKHADTLRQLADMFDHGYVAGKPRAEHRNPACYHCGKRHWDTVEKLASHYIRRHGYVDENSDEAHETSYDVIGQYAAGEAFRREGVPDGGA